MSLPAKWIEKIFHKLTVAYGRDFLGRWEGIPLDAVKADWADCLAGFEANPGAISYALDHLPDSKPPTAQDFRTICCRAPEAAVPRLEAPKPSPERVSEAFSQMAKAREAVSACRVVVDHKAWAKRIVANAAAGLAVNVGPLRMAHQALGMAA